MTKKNDYGFPLEDLAYDNASAVSLLSNYLDNGHVGLILGAGVSNDLNLPNWNDLVTNIAEDVLPGYVKSITKHSTEELKILTDQIKKQINNQINYFSTVKKHLYSGVLFDFSLAKKELLIALSALFIGKHKGTVQNVITFNFDNILEWYFDTIGLEVNIITKESLLLRNSDINITHIHGYLPEDCKYGNDSDFLIFSKKEFIQRLLSGTDYWKDHFYEFFRRQVFLSVGLSSESLENDIFPYLEQMDEWYEIQKRQRMFPYGFAILTPGKASEDVKDECLEHGVIPFIVEIKKIPSIIFEINQIARSIRLNKTIA